MQVEAGFVLVLAVGVGTAVATLPHRNWFATVVVAAVAVVAVVATAVSRTRGWQPAGPLFPVFATAACSSVVVEREQIPVAVLVAASAAVYAVVAASVVQSIVSPRPTPSLGTKQSATARRTAPAVAGVAVLLAGLLSTVPHLGHPYWSAVAAAAVVSGSSPGIERGAQRVVGTAVGLAAAGIVLSWSPSPFAQVVLVVAFQMAGEYLVGANYAAALVFITPVAVLMAELGRAQSPLTLLRDRGLETVVGAVAAVLVIGVVRRAARIRRGQAPG